MFSKLKAVCRATAAAEEQSVSMRRRLYLYWLCMALAVFAMVMLVLSFTGVFSNSAKRLKETLTQQQQNTNSQLSGHLDDLTAQCITLSRAVTGKLSDTLLSHGNSFGELNDDEALITELESELYPLLSSTLQSSSCSGIFVLLDATCNTQAPGAEHSRMGLYLRYSSLSGVSTTNKHMVYFRGAAEVARREKLQMHNRWNLEFDTSLLPGYELMMTQPVTRLANGCLWTERIHLKDTWEDAILLCVPVLGSDDTVLGICGVELSELYFRLSYPAADSPYGSMTVLLAPVEGNTIFLDSAMLGASEDTVLEPSGALTVKEGKYYNLYSTGSQDYIGLHNALPATTVSGKCLSAVTLIPAGGYQASAAGVRAGWIIGSLAFLLIMLILSWLLTRHFITPIDQLMVAVRQELPLEDQHSGISEVDELIAYIQSKAQNQAEGELPPSIEELLQSFAQRVATLTPMERTVLQYYIDGCDIDEIAARAFISVNTVKKHNTNVNRKLGVSSREELSLYIDLFRRCGRLDEISAHV